jgi:hypothetical protein
MFTLAWQILREPNIMIHDLGAANKKENEHDADQIGCFFRDDCTKAIVT